MKSSSESIPFDAVVSGVGGAASGPAEAMILLFGRAFVEDIVASAAFRLRVVGGMVPAFRSRPGACPVETAEDGVVMRQKSAGQGRDRKNDWLGERLT